MYKLCLSLMIAVAVPSIADAAGGGTKANGQIQFFNQSGQIAFVIVDPSDQLLQQLNAGNFDNFANEGGRALTAGENTTYANLRAGKHRWAVGLSPDTPANINFRGQTTVNVKAGKTEKLYLKTP